jgi:hypothetical protein
MSHPGIADQLFLMRLLMSKLKIKLELHAGLEEWNLMSPRVG